MIVERTCVLPADRDTVLRLLQRLDTLQYIARPFAAFEPVGAAPAQWRPGGAGAYRLRLFGFLPLGTHTITIERFGPDGVSSREGNAFVPVWNHEIRLVPRGAERTEYTDSVELHAGWKTPFVWLWAEAFYAHRQRRWRRLLRTRRG